MATPRDGLQTLSPFGLDFPINLLAHIISQIPERYYLQRLCSVSRIFNNLARRELYRIITVHAIYRGDHTAQHWLRALTSLTDTLTSRPDVALAVKSFTCETPGRRMDTPSPLYAIATQIENVLEACPNLVDFDLGVGSDALFSVLRAIRGGKLPALRRLSIRQWLETEEEVEDLVRTLGSEECPVLLHYHFGGITIPISDKTRAALTTATGRHALKTMELGRATSLGDLPLILSASDTPLQRLCIELRDGKHWRDTPIVPLPPYLANLTHLHLNGYHALDQRGVIAATSCMRQFQSLPSLKHLTLKLGLIGDGTNEIDWRDQILEHIPHSLVSFDFMCDSYGLEVTYLLKHVATGKLPPGLKTFRAMAYVDGGAEKKVPLLKKALQKRKIGYQLDVILLDDEDEDVSEWKWEDLAEVRSWCKIVD